MQFTFNFSIYPSFFDCIQASFTTQLKSVRLQVERDVKHVTRY